MLCRDCPYIKNEYTRCMNCYSNIYKYTDYAAESEKSCECEKLDTLAGFCDSCEDSCSNYKPIQTSSSGKVRVDKYHRKKQYKQKLKNACDYRTHDLWWKDKEYKDGKWIALEKPYIKKYYRSSHRARYYKNYSNRIVRRYMNDSYRNKSAYKKYFDYTYEIY